MAKKKPAGDNPPPTPRALRSQIARLDRQIAAEVAERAEMVRELSSRKSTGKTAANPTGDAAEPYASAIDSGEGPVGDTAMRAVFREVVASSRAAIERRRIAYLGPEDSFSHLTAIARFGEASDLAPVATISAVFHEVASGGCELGVVPLENSTHGRVTDTLEAFAGTDVQICGEAPMRIHHCLLGRGPRSAVKRVHSKPQALSQCGHWLAEHLPGAELHAAASTSGAAELAAKDPAVAAIASEQAGHRHGLEVLARNIEDQKDNVTRFAVIGPGTVYEQGAPKTGDDKTSLMFEVVHEPGSLADAMAIFKRQKLNMTWIESFPIPGSQGRYLFFIEFQGHQAELRARRAIAALEKKCLRLRVLGSYARAKALG